MAFEHTHEIFELFTYLHDCIPLEHLSNETLSDSHSRLRCRAVQWCECGSRPHIQSHPESVACGKIRFCWRSPRLLLWATLWTFPVKLQAAVKHVVLLERRMTCQHLRYRQLLAESCRLQKIVGRRVVVLMETLHGFFLFFFSNHSQSHLEYTQWILFQTYNGHEVLRRWRKASCHSRGKYALAFVAEEQQQDCQIASPPFWISSPLIGRLET